MRPVPSEATIISAVMCEADVVALLLGHRTCDLQVTGSSPGWAPLRGGLGQATYTSVALSPTSIIWYWPKGVSDLFGWENNSSLPPGL